MASDRVITVPGVAGQCPICQHPPIRHIPDGMGYTCLVCLYLAAHEHTNNFVCTLKFEFKLSQREREQAAAAYKGTFPPHTVCAECDCEWQAHQGMLCPTGDSTFLPVLDKDLPMIFTH
jgi:hypothetical protein